MNFLSIQPCGRLGSAHPRITSSNAVSTRISKRRCDRRNERLTCIPSRGMTPRGSGDHHPNWPESDRSPGLQPHREQALAVRGEQRSGGRDQRPRRRSRRHRASGPATAAPSGSAAARPAPPARYRTALTWDFAPPRGPLRMRTSAVSLACRDAARPSIGFARARCRCAPDALHHSRRRARPLRTRADARATRAISARRPTRSPPSTSPRSSACSRSTTTSRAASRSSTSSSRAPSKRARRHAARAQVAYTSSGTQLEALVDSDRHARQRATRAPHRSGERARPGRVRGVAEGDARAAQATARAARHPPGAERRPRRAQGAGRDHRRQAGAGGSAGAGPGVRRRGAGGCRHRGRSHHDDRGRHAGRGRATEQHHHDGGGAERSARRRPTTRARPG